MTKLEKIKKSLITQLKQRGADTPYALELVDRYLDLCRLEESLWADINERGVSILQSNGYIKQNESVGNVQKANARKTGLLKELGLKVADINEVEDNEL